MKKEVFLLIVLVFLLPAAYALSLGTVKGHIYNLSSVIEPGSAVTVRVVGCTGSDCSASGTSDSNGFYIKSNLRLIPGNTVLVNATKGSAFGSNTGTATGSGSVGVATVNVTICVPPIAPSLTPVSDTHDNTLITMSWTTFGTGRDYDEFVFDSDPSNISADSPQTESNVTFASHTWKVRTCNAACCSSFSTDTFQVTNNAPPAPTLTDQAHTQSTTVSLMWSNFSDTDGDVTHNQFQLSTDESFSTLVASDLDADSPKTISSLTTFTLYFWRVRTCDTFGACSGYKNDSFFVYQCPVCSSATQGQTNTVVKTENVTQTCTPQWECGDWSTCSSPGLSTRTCNDANSCIIDVPKPYQLCTYQAPQIEQPQGVAPQQFFLGNYQINDVYQATMGVNEVWTFVYNNEDHSLRVVDITGTGFVIEVSSAIPKQYFIQFGTTKDIDVDGDGIADMMVKPIQPDHNKVSIVASLIKKPEIRAPLSGTLLLKGLQEEAQRTGSLVWILLLVILILVIAILYQQKHYIVREMKVDRRLKEYVLTAQAKGFSDEQVRSKLLENGFAKEEVDYIFSKLKKSKNVVPKKQ